MVRAACAAVVALLLLAAPAAAFQMCDRDGTTVTATFGTETGGLLVQVGSQIHTEDGQCDDATTANTDTIEVVGDSSVELLTIDLAGGTFLDTGGPDLEAGTSDEVEIEVDFGSGFATRDILVRGSGAADHVTLGVLGPTLFGPSAINLNANEASGVDPDVTTPTHRNIEVDGLGGPDVLSAAGDAGIPTRGFASLVGGPGDDDLTIGIATPGPGNDTIRNPGEGAIIRYSDAPNGVVVTLADGTGGVWGGTAVNGDGESPPGTDVYVGVPFQIEGSDAGNDVFNGSAFDTSFEGAGGSDTFNGGSGGEDFRGGAGVDTIHGGDGEDTLLGDAGGDFLYGEGGLDVLAGNAGADTESGGADDDYLVQSARFLGVAESSNPNGADDLSGGPDVLSAAGDAGIP
ncbi:MAG TPA: calcium-binding protein, partial [Solirubrobacteraceae bacterium]|nr:calcium-binding protein [Solirubrobacteraceae bacterium]